jgi:hypothetical protein
VRGRFRITNKCIYIITNAVKDITLSLRTTEKSEVPPLAGLRRFAPRNDSSFNAFVLVQRFNADIR